MINWNKTSKWLKLQKEGFLVGTILAVLVYWFDITIPLLNIEQTGFLKMGILIFIFSSIGALIDSVWRPNK